MDNFNFNKNVTQIGNLPKGDKNVFQGSKSWTTINKSNVDYLENLMFPSFSQEDNRFYPDFYQPGGICTNEDLDDIRQHALEEFRRNGRECDLDEVDNYQVKIRRQNETHINSILFDILEYKKGKKKAKSKKLYCVFCKNNGESASIFTSHFLKDNEGKVLCPILRKYTCPLCGACGDNAHTIKYCSQNKFGQLLPLGIRL